MNSTCKNPTQNISLNTSFDYKILQCCSYKFGPWQINCVWWETNKFKDFTENVIKSRFLLTSNQKHIINKTSKRTTKKQEERLISSAKGNGVCLLFPKATVTQKSPILPSFSQCVCLCVHPMSHAHPFLQRSNTSVQWLSPPTLSCPASLPSFTINQQLWPTSFWHKHYRPSTSRRQTRGHQVSCTLKKSAWFHSKYQHS